MKLFKTDPPKVCPKCGKANSWRFAPDDTPENHAETADLGNPYYLDSLRDPFFNNIGGPAPKTKYRYCCDSCGYEKTYRV